MMDVDDFLRALKGRGLDFITGVPDSLLSSLGQALRRSDQDLNHVIAVNEGQAIALAVGHFLGAGRPAAVYMQNSGLGNAVNPLVSLADPLVYAIPMFMIIGWRGEPGVKDEPQHIKQGLISPALLETLDIPYKIVGADSNILDDLEELWTDMLARSGPVALLVRAGAFKAVKNAPLEGRDGAGLAPLMRETAIECLLSQMKASDRIVATTGKTSRELYELRARRGEAHQDFLTVGSMGHSSSIALAAALARPDKRLICLDGDGALLMHLGALALIGTRRPANFIHILLNNKCHESVGGSPTCIDGLDVANIALACGYRSAGRAGQPGEIEKAWHGFDQSPGPHFLELSIEPGSRPDLGRPENSPRENKISFMEGLAQAVKDEL